MPSFSLQGIKQERLLQFCHSRLGHTVTRHVSAESFTVIPCVNSTLREFSSAIELEAFVEQDCNQFPPLRDMINSFASQKFPKLW